MALKVGELFASFNLDTSGLNGAISSAEKSLSSLGKGLTLGGAAMTAAVTVPLKNAAKEIYTAGSGFDAQMSKVFAIAGDSVTGSAQAMADLRAKALEMGSTTQFTASEAGEAFEYMAMAGWKTEQMLSAIEPLMNLAAAAGADLGTTSDIVTDAMTAFGLSATDTVKVVKDGMEMNVNAVEYFADILAAASSNSNTNVTMLGESFKFAAPLAGSLGYSVNDVAIALGIMANNGIKSSMAGTSLSRVIQNMAKPSDQTAEAMNALGLSLYDSKGNVKSLRDLMMDFRGVAKKNGVDIADMAQKVGDLDAQFASGKITEDQYEKELAKLTEGSGDFLAYVTQIAGARGLPGLLAIMNATDADFDSLAGAIDNATGSARKMKEVMLDNVAGSVTIFKSAVEGLEITLWDLVKEPVKSLIDRGTEIVDKFRQMDSATQMGTLKMAGFAAAMGPVMTATGGLMMALPKVVKGLTLLSSPLGIVGLGLAAFTAAALDSNNQIGTTFESMAAGVKKSLTDVNKTMRRKLLGFNFKTGKSAVGSRMAAFGDSISKGLHDIIPAASETIGTLAEALMKGIRDSSTSLANIGKTLITDILGGLTKGLPKLLPLAADMVTSIGTALISNAPALLDAGIRLFGSLIESIQRVNWGEIGTKIHTAVTTALSEIKTNLFTLVFGEEATEENAGDWGKLGSKVVENIKAGIKTASDNGKNLLGGLVLGDEYNPDDSWGTVAGKIWNKITTSMGTFLTNAGDLLKGLVLGENYTADATWGTVATAIWEKIKSGFETLKQNALDLIGTIALGEGYTADDTWESVASAIWQKIKTKFSTLAADAKEIIGTFALGEGYEADSTWGEIGQAIWNKAKEKFDTLAKSAKDLIGTLVLGDDYTADSTWENVGKAVWDKAKDGFDKLAATAKNIVGTLVLGDDYTADTSWGKIGEKIWETAKAKFGELAADAKNLIGSLVLGDDYDPGDSWQKIGSAIWDKAKNGFSSAYTAAKEIIGTFALGEDYEADTSWSKIGEGVFDKIKTGLGDVGEKIKGILAKLAFSGGEEGYQADASWAEIGSALWNKVQSGIGTAKEFGEKVLEKISNIDIDVSGVVTTVKNAATFATNLVKNMLDGKITWGTKITDFAKKIGQKLADFGWDNIGTTFGTTAGNLVKAITDAIPKAVDAAGNALDVGLTLAGGIIDSIVSAFDSFNPDINFSGIVSGLVNNLITAVPKVFELGGKALSAGAHIAQSILQSIATALQDVSASGIAEQLGKAATELLKNLLGNVGGLTDNPEVTTFLENVGKAIMDGMGALGEIVGSFAGKLIGYLFSTEGLTDILNAGVTIGNLILSGIMQGIAGIGNFLKEMVTSTLVGLGVLSEEEVQAAKKAGTELAKITAQAFNEAESGSLTLNPGMEVLINWANWRGGQNRSEITPAAQDLVSAFNGALAGAAEKADTGESFRDAVLENMFWSNGDLLTRALENNIDLGADDLNIAEVLSQLEIDPNDIIPNFEDIKFWDNLLEAMKSGNVSEIMNVVNDALELAMAGVEKQTEELTAEITESVETIPPEVQTAEEKLKALAGETEKAMDIVVQAVDQSGNALAQNGVADSIAAGQGAAQDAALQVSDAVVQEFLMTMSYDNGYLIGEQFVLAINAALEAQEEPLSEIALAAGQMAYASLSGAASYSNGYTIGYNFGYGFVQGIESMIARAAAAASSLGAAAGNSLSDIIREGSPSRWTREIGDNFGLGFIYSIVDAAESAADAAALMGRSAGNALQYATQSMGREAVDMTDLPVRSRSDAAARDEANRSGSQDVERFTDIVVDALGRVVVVMDSEQVGHLVADTVSQDIGHGAAMKR